MDTQSSITEVQRQRETTTTTVSVPEVIQQSHLQEMASASESISVGVVVARPMDTQSSITEVQRQRETTTTTVSVPEVMHQSYMQEMVSYSGGLSLSIAAFAKPMYTQSPNTMVQRQRETTTITVLMPQVIHHSAVQNMASALVMQPMPPVGYLLVQDQSGQFFLMPQISITGGMMIPSNNCESCAQKNQPIQEFTLVEPQQEINTLSTNLNDHYQNIFIANADSFPMQQASSSTPLVPINTHQQLSDTTLHQQLTSPENQMITFNEQQSTIVSQPFFHNIQPIYPGLTIATQMQNECQNQINDMPAASESELTQELESIVFHDASNQTDLQTDDETYQSLTEEITYTNLNECTQVFVVNDQPLDDISRPENSATTLNTGLELLLNCIELVEKQNSSELLNINHQDIVTTKEESENIQTADTNANIIGETEEIYVTKVDSILSAGQHFAQKLKEKQNSSSSSLLSNVTTIKINKIDTYSKEQNKIKPELKTKMVKIKHWDADDEDGKIKDPNDLQFSPEHVSKKRRISDSLIRKELPSPVKPAVIPEKLKFSNVSLDSTVSSDNILSSPQRDTHSLRVSSVRDQSPECVIPLEQTNKEEDSPTLISPSRVDDDNNTLKEIWKWAGESYIRHGSKKMFYKSVCLGDKVISIGDCAIFLSSASSDRPFIGKVYSMWETKLKKIRVNVFWFYHPEDTASGLTSDLPYPGALFKSSHKTDIDIQSILKRCDVISFDEFKTVIEKEPERLSTIYDKNDLFFLAGEYEPVLKLINFDTSVVAASKNK